jgi:acetolactate synthase-1/2/3 large subunit
MGETIEMINKHSKEMPFWSDVGQHQMFAVTEIHITKSNVTSGGLGTMGFVLPACN